MLEIGTILDGHRNQYRLTGLLGEGLTARVYKAELIHQPGGDLEEVAIKVLKPGLSKNVVERFMTEAQHLAEVDAAIAKWTDERGHGVNSLLYPASPPRYYEVYEGKGKGEYTFMVIELMKARQLEAILVGERGRLDEIEGLRIGIQLFGLFEVLHEWVKRTYTDFKFENLWLQDNGRVRVTDWNVLSRRGDLNGIYTDLDRAARAVVRILTGLPLPPYRRLQRHPHIDFLSEGMRRALHRMLHPNPQYRFATAAEVRERFLTLLSYWEEHKPLAAVKRAERAIAGVEMGLRNEHANHTQLISIAKSEQEKLDILLQRWEKEQSEHPEVWSDELYHRVEKLYQRTSALIPSPKTQVENAIALLRGGSTRTALEDLTKTLDEYPDFTPAHRLRSVAEAIEKRRLRSSAERERVLAAIRGLQEDRPDYGDLLRYVPKEAVPALFAEIKLYSLLRNAQQFEIHDDIEAAWEKVREAIQTLESIEPKLYREAVIYALDVDLEEYGRSLKTKIERVQYEKRLRQFVTALEKAKTPAKIHDGVEIVEEKLPDFAGEQSAIDAAFAFGKWCLRHGQLEMAKRVFATGAALDHNGAIQFRAYWQIVYAAQLFRESPDDERTQKEVEVALAAAQRSGGTDIESDLRILTENTMASSGSESQDSISTAILETVWRRNPLQFESFLDQKIEFDGIVRLLRKQIRTPSISQQAKQINSLAKIILECVQDIPEHSLDLVTELWELAGYLLNLSGAETRELEKLLREYTEEFAKARDERARKLVLAKASGMPVTIAILETLVKELDENKRIQLAKEYRRMFERLGIMESFTPIYSYSSSRKSFQEKRRGPGERHETISGRSQSLQQTRVLSSSRSAYVEPGRTGKGDRSHLQRDARSTKKDMSADSDRPIVSVPKEDPVRGALGQRNLTSTPTPNNTPSTGDIKKLSSILEQAKDLYDLRERLIRLSTSAKGSEKEYLDKLKQSLVGWGPDFYAGLEREAQRTEIPEPSIKDARKRMQELEKMLESPPWQDLATMETPAFRNTYRRLEALTKKSRPTNSTTERALATPEAEAAKPSLPHGTFPVDSREKTISQVQSLLQSEPDLAALSQELEKLEASQPAAQRKHIQALRGALAGWGRQMHAAIASREETRDRHSKIWAKQRMQELEKLASTPAWRSYRPFESKAFQGTYRRLQHLASERATTPQADYSREMSRLLQPIFEEAQDLRELKQGLEHLSETGRLADDKMKMHLQLLIKSLVQWQEKFYERLDLLEKAPALQSDDWNWVQRMLQDFGDLRNKEPWKQYTPMEAPMKIPAFVNTFKRLVSVIRNKPTV